MEFFKVQYLESGEAPASWFRLPGVGIRIDSITSIESQRWSAIIFLFAGEIYVLQNVSRAKRTFCYTVGKLRRLTAHQLTPSKVEKAMHERSGECNRCGYLIKSSAEVAKKLGEAAN